jgi:hypothetical protein
MKKGREAGFLRKELLDICRKQCWLNGEYEAVGGVDCFQCVFYGVEWTLRDGWQ